MNDVVRGDATSRSKWFGRMIGEAALTVVGTKGVDKVVNLAKGTRFVQEVGGIRILKNVLEEKKPSPPHRVTDTEVKLPKEPVAAKSPSSKAKAVGDWKGNVDFIDEQQVV